MKLSELLKEREVLVPGTDIKAVIKEQLSWYEYMEAMAIKDLTERGIYAMSKLIVYWNIEGDDQKELPITNENIIKLPQEVGQFFINHFNKIISERRKKKTK